MFGSVRTPSITAAQDNILILMLLTTQPHNSSQECATANSQADPVWLVIPCRLTHSRLQRDECRAHPGVSLSKLPCALLLLILTGKIEILSAGLKFVHTQVAISEALLMYLH